MLRGGVGLFFDTPNANPFLDNRPGNSAPNGLAGPPHQNPAALTKLLILVMAAVLSGMANAIREFIKEREIFERERMAGLSAGAYLMSKVLVLGVISVLQTLLIVIIGLVPVIRANYRIDPTGGRSVDGRIKSDQVRP